MIPSVFDAKSHRMTHLSASERQAWARRMSGSLIGIAGAIGALGGVGVNLALRMSYLSPAKSASTAFLVFMAFYGLCAAITWTYYVRIPNTRLVTAAPTSESAAVPA